MLSNPRVLYGIHSVTPTRRDNALPYGYLRVLGGSQVTASGETQKLYGGSSRIPWAAQDGAIENMMNWKTKEFPSFLWTLFAGAAPTDNAAETSGNVSTLTNVKGSSLVSATTGVATSTLKSGQAAKLKFGKYIVVAASATTVHVYCLSDVDFSRGGALTYQDDNLKITASALSITASTAVEIPNTGVELTGGSGTIALVEGDTAEFYVRPVNTKSSLVTVGGIEDEYPEFGAMVLGEKRASGEMVELEFYRCKGQPGMSLPFEESKFVETELKVDILHDSAKGAAYRLRHVTPA